MDESSVSYGTPTNGASPGANPILAQPPLPDANDQNEGKDACWLLLHPSHPC